MAGGGRNKKAVAVTTSVAPEVDSENILMAAAAPPAVEQPALKLKPTAKKGGRAALQDKAKNVDYESELLALTARLEQVTLEKEKAESLLNERLQEKEEETAKLQKEVKKLQKQKVFQPDLGELSLDLLPARGEEEEEKKKDPRKPKKALSAYLLWCNDKRAELRAQHPSLSLPELAKLMGERWKEVDAKEKKKYEEQSAEQMSKYKEEKAKYDKMIDQEEKERAAVRRVQEGKRQEAAAKLMEAYEAHVREGIAGAASDAKKKGKDGEKPKHPISAFLAYCRERRVEMARQQGDGEKRDAKEETKLLAEEWNKIKDTKKAAPYEKISNEDKVRYARELKEYQEKKQQEEQQAAAEKEKRYEEDKKEAMQLLKKEEKERAKLTAAAVAAVSTATHSTELHQKMKKTRDPLKPKRPPNGYQLYCNSVRAQVAGTGLSFTEINAKLAAMWKDLNEKDKDGWKLRAAPAMEDYKTLMAQYGGGEEAADE